MKGSHVDSKINDDFEEWLQKEFGQIKKITDTRGKSHVYLVDRLLDKVYGDHIHQNPGTHLDGGVADDFLWQSYWRQLVEYTPSFEDTPTGALGKRLVGYFAKHLEGIMKQKWNGEKLIVFSQVIYQRSPGIKRAKDVRRHITHKLDLWDKGKHQLLYEMTLRDLQACLSKS